MSRLFKKNNSVSKVVALWLVFVMMATPFFAHAGIEKDSKAEEPEPIVGEISTAVKISATKCSLVSDGSTGVKLAVTDDALFLRYYYGIDQVTCDGGTAEIIDGSIADGKLLISLDSEDYKVSVTNDVMYCIADSSSALPAELPNGDSQLKDSVTTEVPGKYIGIYIKPEVTKTNGTAVSCDTYTKVGYYSFTEKDPFYNITWKLKDDNSNVVDDDKWYNATCIDGESGNNDYLPNYPNYTIGEIQYGYVTKGGDTSNIIWEGKVGPDFAGSLGTKKQQVSFSNIDGMEDVYDVYLGCFVDNQLVASKKIDTVNVDKKEPVIDTAGTGLYYSYDGVGFAGNDLPTEENAKKYGSNSVLRKDRLGDYAIYLNMEEIAGSPVDTIEFNVNGTIYTGYPLINDGSTYRNRLSFNTVADNVWLDDANNVFQVQVTDEAGNSSTFTIPGGFTFADENHFSATVDLQTLEGTDVTYTADSDIITDENYNLVIDIESYKEINSVVLYNDINGDGNFDTNEVVVNQTVEPNYTAPYYKNEVTIKVPGDELPHNAEYESLKLAYCNGGTTLKTTVLDFDLLYDNTDPVVLVEDGSAPLPTELPGTGEWYDSTYTQDFKFVVKSGDTTGVYESDITLECKVDGTPVTPSKNGDVYTIPLSSLESQNTDGTGIFITVTDEAGNKYQNMHRFKYDKTKPTWDATDGLYLKQNSTSYINSSEEIFVNNMQTANSTSICAKYSDNVKVDNVYYKLSKWNAENSQYDIIVLDWTSEPADGLTEHSIGVDELITIYDGSTDGKYQLEVYVVDRAGNESTRDTVQFTVDSIAPTIDSITLQYKNDSVTEWTDVPSNEAFIIEGGSNAGKNAIFLTEDTEYRYVVKHSDTNITEDIAVADIVLNLDCVDTTSNPTTIPVTDGEFVLEVNETNVSPDIPEMIKVRLKDKAGNEVALNIEPLLQTLDDNVRIKAYLLDENGNEIESLTQDTLPEIIAGEKEYKIRVDYYSTSMIDITTDVPKLTYTPASGTETVVSYSTSDTSMVTQKSNEFNNIDKKYHLVVDYILPNTENIKFNTIKVYAANTLATPKTKEVALSDILFDKSKPVVLKENSSEAFTDNGMDAEGKFVWCTLVDAKYVVKSGTESYESKLESVEVKVSSAGDNFVEMITDANDAVPNNGQLDPVESYTGTIYLDASSATYEGTDVVIKATDVAGNMEFYYYTYRVDTTQPTATLTVNDKTSFTDDITGMPTIKATAKDTLTLQSATIYVQAPNGITYTKTYHNAKEAADNITKEATYTLADIIGAENVTDGTYSIWMNATDNVSHSQNSASVSFTLDNTLPTVTAKITSGTVSSKSSYYYNTDVTVTFTKSDKNMEFITVKDGDKTVDVKWSDTPDANGVYTGTATFTAEGAHSVTISAQDNAGNQSTPTTVSFLIDKTKPVVSTTLGGVIYTDESGFKYFTSNVSLGASVSDTNEDKKDLNYQIIQAKPDQEVTTSSYIETSARSFDYTEEADYTINLFAVDHADNTSATRTVKFRVDKNAPKLTIGGVGNGAASSATTVSFTMEEAFWKDASGKITIYRKPGEGQGEELLKTIDVTPTAFETVVRETLTETGIYRIEFSATDRAGHSSATNTTFTIDKDAPVVTLTSADNYALTDEAVPTTIEITDDFYITKKITLSGTRTDIDGKVNNIDFGDYNPAGNPTIIYQNFEEDGIYDIEVTVTDVAGNSDTKSVHFTIDKTDPVIGDLPDIDGKILTSFSWEEDLDELVSDLTVCDVHMYLNGSEYDGESAIEDGSYTLLITAEDELGHKVEKQVSFILDTKAPVFIVTGVEDGEVKNEEYAINVSLQLEEDTLTSVKLNGEDVLVSNNTCTISVTEKGEYVLEMTAIDEAGNESSMKLEFKYGEEAKGWLWIIIVAASVLLLGGIGFIVWKKKKDK